MPATSERAPARILTVDDDPDLIAAIELRARRWGYEHRGVTSAADLWAFLERSTPDAVLLDVMLGDADGSRLVGELKRRLPELPVIMITRSTSVDAAVRCMKHGATDYITKPLDFERLRRALGEALEVGRLARRLARLGEAAEGEEPFGMVGRSAPMRRLYRLIANLAPTDVSALILGETGTGKELVARAVHQASPRRGGPFVAVNAAAIPRDLIESMLFGHEKGAFTGADQTHVGFCEQADGGTLFLDEIAEMGFEVQAKLLRFLQDHVVQRLGSSRTLRVDVRVLGATNVDPRREMAERRLREDLYYRLRVVSLQLPPLRERAGDVELLAGHFLRRAAARHARGCKRISPAAETLLASYSWPGNVRELENVIEEAVVLHRGEELTLDMLPAEITGTALGTASAAAALTPQGAAESRLNPRQALQRQALLAALERHAWDPEAAAAELGVSRATVYRRMKKHGLSA